MVPGRGDVHGRGCRKRTHGHREGRGPASELDPFPDVRSSSGHIARTLRYGRTRGRCRCRAYDSLLFAWHQLASISRLSAAMFPASPYAPGSARLHSAHPGLRRFDCASLETAGRLAPPIRHLAMTAQPGNGAAHDHLTMHRWGRFRSPGLQRVTKINQHQKRRYSKALPRMRTAWSGEVTPGEDGSVAAWRRRCAGRRWDGRRRQGRGWRGR